MEGVEALEGLEVVTGLDRDGAAVDAGDEIQVLDHVREVRGSEDDLRGYRSLETEGLELRAMC